jgi:hypothetical protein
MINKEIKANSIGRKIDLLICSNLKNWQGKENFYNLDTGIEEANKGAFESFKANKIRNLMITQINKIIHNGPVFHFRNYHNY